MSWNPSGAGAYASGGGSPYASPSSPVGGQSSEKSVKSCYAVVYQLQNRKWNVSGEGGWSEVHLCKDSADNTYRLLAWTVKSQAVLMNCNVTSECAYKEKSKNFHSFTDENGGRFGLGFHKSEPGLKQALAFLDGVVGVIELCKQQEAELQALQPQPAAVPPPFPQPQTQMHFAAKTPPPMSSAVQSTISSTMQSVAQSNRQFDAQTRPPPLSSLGMAAAGTGSGPSSPKSSGQLSPVSSAVAGGFVQPIKKSSFNPAVPSYHERSDQTASIPRGGTVAPTLGDLVILPPKPKKHASGDQKIKMPNAVKHQQHVTFDKSKGQYTGLPEEWLEELNKQFGVKPTQLPCVEISGYGGKIPKILVDLAKRVQEKGGFQQVGIFRLAPNAADNELVKQKLNRGDFESTDGDVNVYANLIKVWFRDLPQPLLSCVAPEVIEMAQKSEDVVRAVGTFPEPYKSIFLWLCDLCVDVAVHEEENKMGPQNLAIVIGPNLFNTNTFENPMKAMTYSGKVVQFFQKAIVWRQSVRDAQ